MNVNEIVVVGNLTEDPELRYTPNGKAVAKMKIAVNRRYKDSSGEWRDGDATFLACNVWGQPAENVAESLVKGLSVIVVGRLQQRNWEAQDGAKRSSMEIEVDAVGPSLQWATATVERQTRSGDSSWSGSGN